MGIYMNFCFSKTNLAKHRSKAELIQGGNTFNFTICSSSRISIRRMKLNLTAHTHTKVTQMIKDLNIGVKTIKL